MSERNSLTVVFSAPSGAGKTTLIQNVFESNPEFSFSISTTSRPPRGGESDGKEYYFVSAEDFKNKIKSESFIEWAFVHGNYYGTEKKEIDRIISTGKIPILDIDVQGAAIVREKLENGVYIFIIPPSISVLRERLKARKTDSKDQIALRMKNAGKELERFNDYDYLVINDDLERASLEIESIITAEMCRTYRRADFIKKIIMEDSNDNIS